MMLISSVFVNTSVTASAKSSIKLSSKSIVLTVGKSKTIKLKGISKKQSKKIKWKSNKKRIAVVNKNGKIVAKGKGKTKIIAEYNKKKYYCTVTVKKKVVKPDFKSIYKKYCHPDVAEVAGDNSYLSLDSNPTNINPDDYEYTDYYTAALDEYLYYNGLFDESIKAVNKALGLSESLLEKMNNTSSASGRQTQNYKDKGFYVTWTYNYVEGLLVQYYLY